MKNLTEFVNERLTINKNFKDGGPSETSIRKLIDNNFDVEEFKETYAKRQKNYLINEIVNEIIPDGDTNDIHEEDIKQCIGEMFEKYDTVYKIMWTYDGNNSLYSMLDERRAIEYSASEYVNSNDLKRVWFSRDKFDEFILGLQFERDRWEEVYIATNEKA